MRDTVERLALAHEHYGYRRIAAQMRREGLVVNRKRVLRLMREDTLLCLRVRPFVPATTDSRHAWHVVPNLARGMILTGLDQLWVADITYARLHEEFAYLAIVLDAFSRRVIGWALKVHLQASLAIAALEMALATRRPQPGGLVHHFGSFIEEVYNRHRLHSALDYRSPLEFEQQRTAPGTGAMGFQGIGKSTAMDKAL